MTEIRREFEDIQKLCTNDQCGGRLIEANRLFAAQVKLLRSAGVYTGGEMSERVQELEERGRRMDRRAACKCDPVQNF